MSEKAYCGDCGCTLEAFGAACPSCDVRCDNCGQSKRRHRYVNDGVGLLCPTAQYQRSAAAPALVAGKSDGESAPLLSVVVEALEQLRIDANRLCDRQLGGTYEDDCRRSLRKADAALQLVASTPQGTSEGWQPIANAPKDGTRILITWGDQIRAAYWDDDFDSSYDEERDEVTKIGAWTDGAVQSFNYEEMHSYEPTHWMPLPTPPADLGTPPDATKER